MSEGINQEYEDSEGVRGYSIAADHQDYDDYTIIHRKETTEGRREESVVISGRNQKQSDIYIRAHIKTGQEPEFHKEKDTPGDLTDKLGEHCPEDITEVIREAQEKP